MVAREREIRIRRSSRFRPNAEIQAVPDRSRDARDRRAAPWHDQVDARRRPDRCDPGRVRCGARRQLAARRPARRRAAVRLHLPESRPLPVAVVLGLVLHRDRVAARPARSERDLELESLLAAPARRRLHRPHDLLEHAAVGPAPLHLQHRPAGRAHDRRASSRRCSRGRGGSRSATRRSEPRIRRHHDWLERHRDLEGDGLIWIVQPDESGLDASPQFDAIWGWRAHGRPASSRSSGATAGSATTCGGSPPPAARSAARSRPTSCTGSGGWRSGALADRGADRAHLRRAPGLFLPEARPATKAPPVVDVGGAGAAGAAGSAGGDRAQARGGAPARRRRFWPPPAPPSVAADEPSFQRGDRGPLRSAPLLARARVDQRRLAAVARAHPPRLRARGRRAGAAGLPRPCMRSGVREYYDPVDGAGHGRRSSVVKARPRDDRSRSAAASSYLPVAGELRRYARELAALFTACATVKRMGTDERRHSTGGSARAQRRAVAGAADPRPVRGAAPAGDGAPVHRRVRRHEGRRDLPLRRLRRRAVQLRTQVRLGNRLAELLRARGRSRTSSCATTQPRDDADRGPVQALRRPSRPRLRRRPAADRPALLHQLAARSSSSRGRLRARSSPRASAVPLDSPCACGHARRRRALGAGLRRSTQDDQRHERSRRRRRCRRSESHRRPPCLRSSRADRRSIAQLIPPSAFQAKNGPERHLVDPGQPGGGEAHERDPAADEDGLGAVACEEAVAGLDHLPGDAGTGPAPTSTSRPKRRPRR